MPRSSFSSESRGGMVRIPIRQSASMILGYARGKLGAQIRAVSFLVLYLAAFQFLVLRRPIESALSVAAGIGAVAAGLALFLEGLFLGVMPLGERCGLRLPSRARGAGIVLFSLVLGITATLAEPAIGFLRAQGSAVRPWDAPMLYLLLNRGSPWLVAAIAVGVGIAVVLGVFRFIRNWSLKPFLFTLIPLLLGLSLWAALDPVLAPAAGLAWDAGGVTTGPVTVPLVIALGIGVSRIVGRGDGSSGGLGVVTLASALPVLTVLLLAVSLGPRTPAPSDRAGFFAPEARAKAEFVIGSAEGLRDLAARELGTEDYERWFDSAATPVSEDLPPSTAESSSFLRGPLTVHLADALKAILPLSFVLIFTLRLLLRERIANADEMLLGLGFAVAGLFLFGIGMERGLNILGREAGRSLPQAYTSSPRPDRAETFQGIDESLVLRARGPEGTLEYLPVARPEGPEFLPFDRTRFDSRTGTYIHIPVQRGKQVSLADRAGMFRLVPRVELEDSAADIYRFYAPPDRAEEICARISDFAGLALPGRGSLFVEPAEIVRGAPGGEAPPSPESGEGPGPGKGALQDRLILPSGLLDYTALTCIVQRGQGDALARSVLEMGLCVPVVTYGQGMGLRNKLGLLRITIPVDKEVIYFLVPAADGPLAENIAVHKARLDRPGQGFIYRCRVRAAAVNTRMSRSRRRHVASMEQVILAVDSLQGSTDWRRITAPSRGRGGQIDEGPALACLSVICDEGRAGDFVRAAMEAGAGGATLVRMGYRDLPGAAAEHRGRSPSHARETCDLIVPADLTDDILEALADRGLFEPEVYGLVEITKVEKAVTYRG